jgi:hypothetical protein
LRNPIDESIQQTENEIAKLDKEISDFSNAAHALAEKSRQLSEADSETATDSELEKWQSSQKVFLIHVRDGNSRTGKKKALTRHFFTQSMEHSIGMIF